MRLCKWKSICVMARWRPTVARQQISGGQSQGLNSEYYGQRMGMLMDSGAGRFFTQTETELVNLASSSLSNEDMLETMLIANDQVSLNMLRQQFDALPPQMKRAEFGRLPEKTRNLLLASGMDSPEQEESKNLFTRMVTWDNPLLPEEFLKDKGLIGDSFAGTLFKGVLAPISATGFVLGKTVSTIWEYGAMKPNRFAKRLGRWSAHMEETSDPLTFAKPARWRQAWNNTKIEENSFSEDAIRQSIDLIGPERTRMLRAYLAGGVAEVEQRLIDQGEAKGWSQEEVQRQFYEFIKSQERSDSIKAREVLETHRLDGFNYSIRMYNRNNMGLLPDVDPDSWQGKTVGFTGAMATEILLDPTMYMGGVFVKIFRSAKAGVRGGSTYEMIHFWQRMTEVEDAVSHLRISGGVLSPEYKRAFKEGLADYASEVKEWAASNSGLKMIGATDLNLRAQAHAQNRMIHRITEAFGVQNEIDDAMVAIRHARAAEQLEPLNRWDLEQLAREQVGKEELLAQLSRDFPGVDPVIDDMRNWHAYQRDKIYLHTDDADVFKISDSMSTKLKSGDVMVGREGERIVLTDDLLERADFRNLLRAPDLSTREGYWAFLQDTPGRKALTTSFGGLSPDSMWLPRIGGFGAKWVEGKSYMRKVLKFGEAMPEVEADMARLTANYLAGQTDYVISRVVEDVAEGVIKLSKSVDEDALHRILAQTDEATQIAMGEQLGLSTADLVEITAAVDRAMVDAPRIILEDGLLDPLLRWYQDAGYEIVEGKLKIRRKPMEIPFSGAARAARNYFDDQLHAVGSLNGELSWAQRQGLRGRAAVAFFAYHPAKWAEKLTTYTPKQPYLDVLKADTAIHDFKALIDMGTLAQVPRVQLDNYLRMFITGNEAQRWFVQTQFTLDFLGRSGALLHGGRDVQEFVKKFIRHGNAHYSALQNDFVGVYDGLGLKRAILGSAAHDAQLSRMNIIPNYRELGAVAKYMAFYRRIGWGLHLPTVDKFIARTWRPAVLLRLGYVARNGGEELFSWWLREGPKHWFHQKAARKAHGSAIIWDEYGRKVVRSIDELGDEAHEAVLWKPISRVWRSINEVAGIGDFAITAKAIKKAAEKEGPRWAFMSSDEQLAAFEYARAFELKRIESTPLGFVGRGAFEMGNAIANSYAKSMAAAAQHMGMPSRRQMAQHFLERTDPDHELRIFLSGYALTNPTILDEQMKNILGTFDTYVNFEKNSMAAAMRREGLGSTVPELLKLPIDYSRTALKWVTNAGADANSGTKAIAMSQYLDKLPDDIGSRAMLAEFVHYVSEVQEASLRPIADRLIATLPSAQRARYAGEVGVPLRVEPFDPGLLKFSTEIASSELDEVAEPLVVMVTGSRFRPRNRAPLSSAEIARIQQAIRDSLSALPDGSTVRVGGAAGVDQYAEEVVLGLIKQGHRLNLERYYVPKIGPESWNVTKAAGPLRNRRMLHGDPIDLPAGTPVRGSADVVFAFHPGVGMEQQVGDVVVGGLTGRGFRALRGTLGRDRYTSTKLIIPFSELADLRIATTSGQKSKRFVGGLPETGFIMELTNVRNQRVLVKVTNRSMITDVNAFADINPLDMHLTTHPEQVLREMRARVATKPSVRLLHEIPIMRGKADDLKEVTTDLLQHEEANRLVSFDIEVLAPDALTAEDAALRAAGTRVGSGTESAMDIAFQSGIKIDNGANRGRPDSISEGGQRAGHYRRLRDNALEQGQFVDESIEGGLTVLRTYEKGTQIPEKVIPAVDAVPAMSASGAVLTLLNNNPQVLKRLADAFDTAATENAMLGTVWESAIDDVLDLFPHSQREVWHDLLRPRYSGPVDPTMAAVADPAAPVVRRGLDPNLMGFLLSGANPLRLTDDMDDMARRLQDVYSAALGTPEGQQQAQSMARANLGGDPIAPIVSHPLPESHLRIFMPTVPIELLDDLNDVISGLRGATERSAAFKKAFVIHLSDKLEALGIRVPIAEKVARLLNPASAPSRGATATTYSQLAMHYRGTGQNFVPLVVGSTDDRIAQAISEALIETIAARRGTSVTTSGLPRIVSRDIHADEFFNDMGRAARERTRNTSQPTISTTRGGLITEVEGARRGNRPAPFGSSYYGVGREGVVPVSAFGENGLKGEQVFGISPRKLDPTVGGAKVVEMVDGKPLTRRISVYKHKKGERPPAVVRTGEERKTSWYGDDWELTGEHITTGNDLRNFIEGQAITNSLEFVHHLSNISRGGSPEIFFPWIREAMGGSIDAGRVRELADLGQWWPKAPSHLLAYTPVADEAGGIFGSWGKGWNSLLRNWFDGVVNPMIGAMVREPLFHHYLLRAWKQTADVKILYRHKVGQYKGLANKFDSSLVHYEEGGQLVIKPFESFIHFDWPLAGADPSDYVSKVAFAINDNSRHKFISAIEGLLESDTTISKTTTTMYRQLLNIARSDETLIMDFFGWAKNRKLAFETHRDQALKRAMTLTGAYIDDHRIRSQFQQMVGTMVPFWFAEDQFLRRMGRSLSHTPTMLRRLHLTMSAGVHGGLIQEDQHGNKVLVYPGSEMATTAMLEIADRFPIINRFFGGPLGSVVKSNLSTNIHVLPGYDLDSVGQMGFGPLLAVPINILGNRDPMLRQSFEHNLVGGRYTPDQTGQIVWQSVVPAVIARPLTLALAELGFEPAALVKAQQDIIRLRWLDGTVPSPQEIAAQPNPDLFMEQFMDTVTEEARQYLLLQALTWFVGPATARLSALQANPGFEVNDEFYDILQGGVPWEEAYRLWRERIIADEGEFDPFKYSPFRVSPTDKSTFAVLESTQEANVWLVRNKDFVINYMHTSAFFMPRGYNKDDTSYSAEARSRQHAYGLRYFGTAETFLEKLYYQQAMPVYMRARQEYQNRRYASKAAGLPTTEMDRRWEAEEDMFFASHPIFAARFQSGESRDLRDKTVNELELLVADPTQIPDGPYKGDLILAATEIVKLSRTIRDLGGMRGAGAQRERDRAKTDALNAMERLLAGRPWLNEIHYSVFLPILGDEWIAKHSAGLIGV
jgi:hypothetical protein